MESKTNKERFVALCKSTSREGMEGLLEWLEKSDFYTAPASSRFHGSYPGGLLEHSLNVYDELLRLLKAYPEIEIGEDSAIICSLFHDLCKVDMYVPEKRFRKENGEWVSYDSYTIDEKYCFGGHGSKSVYLAQHFISLLPVEAAAINCHMSSWEDGAARYVGKAFEKYPFAWLLHVADESATYIKEVDNG